MNGPAWRPQVQKLHIYEGIFNLNRAFHATLLSLERLEDLGFFRSEYLNAFKVELERTRANTNDELIETLRDYEQEEGARQRKDDDPQPPADAQAREGRHPFRRAPQQRPDQDGGEREQQDVHRVPQE